MAKLSIYVKEVSQRCCFLDKCAKKYHNYNVRNFDYSFSCLLHMFLFNLASLVYGNIFTLHFL